MSDNKQLSKAEVLIKEIKCIKDQMWNLDNKIYHFKQEVKMKEKILWKECSHEWIRDYTVAFDDHVKYSCKKCSLWRNSYMYE
jgi:hypothetical protein